MKASQPLAAPTLIEDRLDPSEADLATRKALQMLGISRRKGILVAKNNSFIAGNKCIS